VEAVIHLIAMVNVWKIYKGEMKMNKELHPIQKMFEGQKLTAPEKIKLFVMCQSEEITQEVVNEYIEGYLDTFVEFPTVSDIFDDFECNYNIQDYLYNLRTDGTETRLQCEYSRHYESESVAAQMLDGSWVGWTYWYGGGKHGEPEAVEWLEDAYNLECQEEEQVVVVRTFTKHL
jgi:hypothetical protein